MEYPSMIASALSSARCTVQHRKRNMREHNKNLDNTALKKLDFFKRGW
ncbi:MAG: hypothetical protein ACI9JR_002278, partial [Gammaproteobacteria bacterium]